MHHKFHDLSGHCIGPIPLQNRKTLWKLSTTVGTTLKPILWCNVQCLSFINSKFTNAKFIKLILLHFSLMTTLITKMMNMYLRHLIIPVPQTRRNTMMAMLLQLKTTRRLSFVLIYNAACDRFSGVHFVSKGPTQFEHNIFKLFFPSLISRMVNMGICNALSKFERRISS